jgi:hypothetical protein
MSAFGVTITDKTVAVEKPPMDKKKKQAILAGCLIALTVLILAWQYWPRTDPDPVLAAQPQIKPVLEAEKQKDIPRLQSMAVNSDPIIASRAITALAGLGDSSAADQAARDNRAEVRLAAVSALANTRDPARLATLERFTVDPSNDVRLQAVAGIANIPDSKIFKPLTRMLEDPDPVVRNAAVRAIEEKTGLRFRDYDPTRPNPAVIARIKATLPLFEKNFQEYVLYKQQHQQGNKK